jgi:hypothetical protein|tara:strand:+ start:74 stop:568 length:495 start_codon:yes stop_codon:yes gene_type:complete
MKQFEKYGKYKWEFEKGEEAQENCYFRFDEKMMATLMNCDVQSVDSFLVLELKYAFYEESDKWDSKTGHHKLINPTYELQMWGFDLDEYYEANNLNHIKGVLKKYVEKLVKLIDNNNYSWETYTKLCAEMQEDREERETKEKEAWQKKDLDRRIKYTFGALLRK